MHYPVACYKKTIQTVSTARHQGIRAWTINWKTGGNPSLNWEVLADPSINWEALGIPNVNWRALENQSINWEHAKSPCIGRADLETPHINCDARGSQHIKWEARRNPSTNWKRLQIQKSIERIWNIYISEKSWISRECANWTYVVALARGSYDTGRTKLQPSCTPTNWPKACTPAWRQTPGK